MTYRVSRHPDGRHRWWTEDQRIPSRDQAIRFSTDEEALWMDYVLDLDRRNRDIPYGVAVNLRDLMARNDPETGDMHEPIRSVEVLQHAVPAISEA